jgi:pantoate--beta-alanine ligase
VVATSAELAAALAPARQAGSSVGFVPTLGNLHAGHLALIARARRENDLVVVSIFVNPLQFGPNEDFAAYPRTPERDLGLLEAEQVDVAFLPPEREMWPSVPVVRVSAGALGERLEGALRPGHLDGVATVVAKLLHLAGPGRAYFGRKDAQQLALVRRMVTDLAFPNEIVACSTVREPDGLALSSRNAYLSPEERHRASVLYQALEAGRAAWREGEKDPGTIEAATGRVLSAAGGIQVQYVALVDADSFEPVGEASAGQVLALAAKVGTTRLIDNVVLE